MCVGAYIGFEAQKGTDLVGPSLSTIAVILKESRESESIVQKALDTLKAQPEEKAHLLSGQDDTFVGYVGCLKSVGKELAKISGKARSVFIGTHGFPEERPAKSGRLSDGSLSSKTLDLIIALAARQKGGWSFLGTDDGQLLAGRDIIGQRPLFYGTNERFTATSSCRKALWSLGISDVDCIPPGTICELGRENYREQRIGELDNPRSSSVTEDEAADRIVDALTASVEAATRNTRRVGILFSGGVDSSFVAAAANSLGLETRLYTSVFEGSSQLTSAERSADILGLTLNVKETSFNEVEEVLQRVVWVVESADPVQVCVGMAIDVAVRFAVEMGGENLLLSGSGADEVFGGYSKYAQAYRELRSEGAECKMFKDVLNLGRGDLLRDGAIAEANRVQLCAPYLDLGLVKLGLGIPVCLKLGPSGDDLRKRVLRKAAERMGVPHEIAWAPKKAAQYSSGSLASVRTLAKRKDMVLNDYLQSVFRKVFGGCYSRIERYGR
jgi:asparagine synthase (glutamine-hydrolysing)